MSEWKLCAWARNLGRPASPQHPKHVGAAASSVRALIAAAALVALGAFGASTATAVDPIPSGTTYYVAASGSDANPGTSPATAWRTVSRVNRADLNPGDAVLFQGGYTFSDTTLSPADSGASGDPIVYGSYDGGQAKLAPNEDQAVLLSTVDHLTFTDLAISGVPQGILASASGSGASDITIRNTTI